jgi:hypothetical protein
VAKAGVRVSLGGDMSDELGDGGDTTSDSAIVKASGGLLPELIAAARQEGAKIEVNVLLATITEKSQSPQELVLYSEQVLEIARKFEDHRVETFRKLADAVIEVKTKDPDEVEKRANNGMRRRLKAVIATCGIGCLAGTILVGSIGGSLLATVILGTAGAMCLAMLGPLASGESLSASDGVRLFRAATGFLKTAVPMVGPREPQQQRRKKR